MENITWKLANDSDADLLYQWANDDDVRKNSYSSAKIPYEDYLKWLSKCLNEKKCDIHIFYDLDKPFGQVRLNYADNSGEIDYSISKEFRGQGFGKLIISLIEKIVRKNHPEITVLTAKVKPDNIASQKIFEDNNFLMIKSDAHAVDYEKNIQIKDAKISNTDCLINISGGGERILFLTNNRNALKLYDWLIETGNRVYLYSETLSAEQITHMKPCLIISYNYNYIIPNSIISLLPDKVINLHTSYLPWNKGFSPNFWSFIDNTPKGVTIHLIDAHLDTGCILYQKEYFFDEAVETFRTTYDKLNNGIVELFCEHWDEIKSGRYIKKSQTGNGTYHTMHDLEIYSSQHPFRWDDNIAEFKRRNDIK